MVSVLTLALNVKNVISLLQSSPHTDGKFTKKSQESISTGTHVTVPSDDATFMGVSPESEHHAGSLPQTPQPRVKSSAQNPKLCGIPHCPSLPGNLDITSGPAEMQKHLSDPVLPVIPRQSGEVSGVAAERWHMRWGHMTSSGVSYHVWTVMELKVGQNSSIFITDMILCNSYHTL